jgi:hypothetical protein
VTDDDRVEEADEPMPTRTKIIVGLVGCVVVLGLGYGMMRMSSRAIRPDQPAPAGHYSMTCAVCHTISADAAAVEVVR